MSREGSYLDAKIIPIIGAHVSCAGGLFRAVENARRIGAEAIQIFAISPRQWTGKLPSPEAVTEYLKFLNASMVKKVYLHAAYLVNLASDDPMILERSKSSLIDHLKAAELIGAEGLIFHVGSGKSEIDREAVLRREVSAIKEVLTEFNGKAKLIMENSAGGGGRVGSGPIEMGYLLRNLKSERVKVCFDTAHAFEAGLIDDYSSPRVKKFFDLWDAELGLENIIVIHANDSKTVAGSHHDKHENIGKGYMGLDAFKTLAMESRLWSKPWVLEVPGYDGNGPDKKNIEVLKSCFVA